MVMKSQLEALLFDFDGVLADSEPFHYSSFLEAARPLGLALTWEEYGQDWIGFDDRDLFLQAARRQQGRALPDDELAGLVAAKARAFQAAVAARGAALYPGAVALLRAAAARLPVGICSGATRADIDLFLAATDLADCISVWVTADDVARSKPDPACYRLALERLGAVAGHPLAPDRVVAIEDTPAGLTAARRAGIRALGVAHTQAESALADAWRVAPSLDGLTLDQIEDWLAQDEKKSLHARLGG
ncbi:MAG: HAD family phosphatase [Candidatus Marinimicrobia bacterium]|nr:HAD family phosphatase [Candidatus Neomarinimicrobiota bacterium]